MIRLQQEQNKENLIYNTATAYFQVLIYREQLVILQSDQHKYQEMVSVLGYQLKKGAILEKDVDRVKVNLNTINYQIEDATTRQQLALNTLKNAMGMPLESPLVVEEIVDYELFANMTTNDSLDLEALTDVKINRKSVELQELNVKMQRASFMPT